MKLYIDNGRVSCPRRGDLDVEHCVGCYEFGGIRRDRHRSHVVVCSAASATFAHPVIPPFS